ncbi:MAG: hypothetical protein KC613_13175 [Myxococcales bacterium]|nr:hypothetical protein [Myxococcales bacterium]MCB9523065.1 hypothetical protein [Myxococcales bacterium]
MSDPNGGVFGQWMKMVNMPADAMKHWEGWLGQQLDRVVRSESFLDRAGKAMEGSLIFKARMDKAMEQSLHNLRVPTLGDVQAVFGRVDELERQLDAIRDRLDGMAKAQQTVLDRLAALESTLAAPAPKTEAKAAPKAAPKAEAKAAPKAQAKPAPKAEARPAAAKPKAPRSRAKTKAASATPAAAAPAQETK